jgi:hypothetical protein
MATSTKPSQSTTEPTDFHQSHEFSLVLGGPIYQLFRRCHLAGDTLQLLYRRIVSITALAWLPLFFLAVLDSSAGSGSRISFFRDVEVHARFLVALPVLIAAELIVHLRMRPVIRNFVERRIVLPQDIPRFDKAIASAVNLRNSIVVESGLLLVVYTVGLWVWNIRALAPSSWYDMGGSRWNLTPAGYWYVFVSIPIFQFVLLRWYLRLFIWFRFLWQVSRIDLNLISTHPDRAAGLAFVGRSAYAFGPILFAQGVICAGVVASRVLYGGEDLLKFKLQFVALLGFFLFSILAPLLMFTPPMSRAKRKGLLEYGLLAQRYIEDFDQKWIRNASSRREELLGSGDIQSLADLGNSYQVVREMRLVPFGLQDISRLSAPIVAPFLPLLLTVFSPEDLLMHIIKMVF